MAARTILTLIVSLLLVAVAVHSVNRMLDVVKIAERRGPTAAAAGFSVRLVGVMAIIAILVSAWHTSS